MLPVFLTRAALEGRCFLLQQIDPAFSALQSNRWRRRLVGLVLALGVCVVMCAATGMGAMQLGGEKTLQILWGGLTGNLAGLRPNEFAVVWDIRLPRILCGAFVGAGLAMGGTIFQSLLRNPLADPYTLGVSTGAAFGAAAAIYAGIVYGVLIPTAAAAFLCAFVTLLVVILIARQGGGMRSSNLVVAGIIVSAILSSGISFLKMLAGENVSAIVFWLMGSLSSKTWSDVALVAPIVTVAGAIAIFMARDLNVMTLGDDTADSLGVDVRRVRLVYLVLGACITAACVSVSGVIGFVGLVVPHILRFWLTSDNRALLPLSALLGSLLLLLADNATRLLAAGEIPVGVLTTLLGGPFFIYVFLRRPNGGKIDG